MMNAISNRSRSIGIVVGATIAAIVWVMGIQLTRAEGSLPPPPSDLTGEALAQELGLVLTPSQPAGCTAYAVVEGPDVGYCLDDRARPGIDTWEIGRRLAGIVPTELERRIFHTSYELSQVDREKDAVRFERLAAELRELLAG
jgi:hypothetical protein